MPQDRVIGLVALIIGLLLILLFAISSDTNVYNPFNTQRAQTTTAQGTPRPDGTRVSTQRPFATRTPSRNIRPAMYAPNEIPPSRDARTPVH